MPKKVDALQCWFDLKPGCLIFDPGCAALFKTGDWRTGLKPKTDYAKCSKCGRCYIFCPDMSYLPKSDGTYTWLGEYCKGCGICAKECPTGAIVMEVE